MDELTVLPTIRTVNSYLYGGLINEIENKQKWQRVEWMYQGNYNKAILSKCTGQT